MEKTQTKTKKMYRAANGAHLTQQQAQRYGERIENLKDKSGGDVTPKIVLEDARSNSSPLHDYFTWDDTVAAERYRLSQANYLLRSISITIISNGETVPIRAFYNIKVSDEEEESLTQSVYVNFDRVVSDKEVRRQVLEAAYKELLGWKERFKQYKEFEDIVYAIDKYGGKMRVDA